MKKIIGFIGCGNMGQAMMKGIIANSPYTADQIHVADVDGAKLKQAQQEMGVVPETDNLALAGKADILILSIKPQFYQGVIAAIKDSVKAGAIIITIAAGQMIATTEERFGHPIKLVRVMPNTPAMVGMGMTALTPNSLMTAEETQEIVTLFDSFGKSEIVPESLMDAVVAVSGSSPAFVFMFIEAMADGAVAAGMPRAQAYTFAAQAVMGSAKMVLETGKHPGELKDMVCSPAGTTIDAVAYLEKTGFRSAVIGAIEACVEKSKAMS